MTCRLLYVSVKVKQIDSAKRIAGEVDCLRAHVGAIEALAGHHRAGPAIIGAGSRRLADPNRAAVNLKGNSAVAFASRDQHPSLPGWLKTSRGRAVHIAWPIGDQSRA
jgi:hypothetical protein